MSGQSWNCEPDGRWHGSTSLVIYTHIQIEVTIYFNPEGSSKLESTSYKYTPVPTSQRQLPNTCRQNSSLAWPPFCRCSTLVWTWWIPVTPYWRRHLASPQHSSCGVPWCLPLPIQPREKESWWAGRAGTWRCRKWRCRRGSWVTIWPVCGEGDIVGWFVGGVVARWRRCWQCVSLYVWAITHIFHKKFSC